MFNSWWLIYLAYLVPIIALGLIIATIAYFAYNWLTLSDAIGSQLGRKKKPGKKKSSTIRMVTAVAVWIIAAFALLQKCGGLFCKATFQPWRISTQIQDSVNGSGPGPTLPWLSSVVQLSSIVQSNWFTFAFLGLLTVSSVIAARGVVIYLKGFRADALNQIAASRVEGVTAVEDAMRILKTNLDLDPRSRIINCYQRMVKAAQGLGATVMSNQTARELETAIRRTLFIDSSAIRELTDLFEEARYSLHPITEDDADQAQHCLAAIAERMTAPLAPLYA